MNSESVTPTFDQQQENAVGQTGSQDLSPAVKHFRSTMLTPRRLHSSENLGASALRQMALRNNVSNNENTKSSRKHQLQEAETQVSKAPTVLAHLSHFPRISRSILGCLPSIFVPLKYSPETLRPKIVHIGTGNFALAHISSYIHDYLQFDPTWGMIMTSIMSDRLVGALSRQDNLYVLLEKTRDKVKAIAMAQIVKTIFGGTHPEQIINAIASPETKLITITVTNNGYMLDANLKIDMNNENVKKDCEDLLSHKTVYGYIAAGIEKRIKVCNQPLTIMSLDNIPNNTKTFSIALMEFISRSRPHLTDWIKENVDFLTTLVDRITPEPTELFKNQMQALIKLRSQVVIGTEEYRQLVVEKGRFESPDLAKVNVKIVDDCGMYMQRKFYCLNTSHMILSQCGNRLGYKFVHDTFSVPAANLLISDALNDCIAFLDGDKQELREYAETIKSRLGDPSLNDTVKRVGARMTSKIPERVVSAALKYKQATGKPMKAAALSIALYIHNLERRNERGVFFDITDTQEYKAAPAYRYILNILKLLAPDTTLPDSIGSTTLKKLADGIDSDGLRELANDADFCKVFTECVLNIRRKGLRATIYILLGLDIPEGVPTSIARNQRPVGPKRAISYQN